MGDVTGPISTLPGARHSLPDGTMCDDHPDRPAVARIQGETDSFGCEMHDLCAECLRVHREEMRDPNAGRCDWCGTEAVSRTPARDYEEGKPADHNDCWLIGGPCWHDGTSLYASEFMIPLLEREGEGALWEQLEREYEKLPAQQIRSLKEQTQAQDPEGVR